MSPVPVTVLSGFIGADKTKLLKNVLQSSAGAKVGIVMTDAAELDLDATLIKSSEAGKIEMQNGCACCSAADEILQGIATLMKLARDAGASWDHIVVDSPGVAEQREMRDNFRNALVSSPAMLEGTKLFSLITVVDASTFVDEFEKRNKLLERPDLGTGQHVDGNRQVADLMCEQIECADVLVLNKADLIADVDQLHLVKEAMSSLNPNAQVHTSERGRVDLTAVLGAAKGGGVAEMDEDMEHRRMVAAAKKAAAEHARGGGDHSRTNGHLHLPGDGVDENTVPGSAPVVPRQRFGIQSFCYQRRLPFHPHRLMGVIRELPVRLDNLALSEALNDKDADPAAFAGRSPMRCLVRAKGFVWLSNAHSQIFYWALAGKHFELKHYAAWWASHPRDEWPTDAKEVADIKKDFEGDMGDRRQELVFVGVNMDVAAITKLLDDCLLKESEMNEYRKRERPAEEADA